MDRRSKRTYPTSSMTYGTTQMGQIPQKNDCFACLYAVTKATTEPVCMYALPACMPWQRPRRNLFACILCLQNQHPLRMKILRGLIKYAHNMYDGMTWKIQSKDTIVSLPEEKMDSCQSNSECWCMPGVCTCQARTNIRCYADSCPLSLPEAKQ